MSVVLFANDDEYQKYLKHRQIHDIVNFEKVYIRSFFDSMVEFAEEGFCGAWLLGHFPIKFGNYFSDISVDLPSFAYNFNGMFVGSSGLIQESPAYVPWRNFQKIDQNLRRAVTYVTGCVIDPNNHIYSFSTKDGSLNDVIVRHGKNKLENFQMPICRFHDSSPLHGPYISDQGAYCLFGSVDDAVAFANSRGLDTDHEYDILQFENAFEILNTIEYNSHFIDISLNAASPRYMQGYFSRRDGQWILRTVLGTFEISPGIAPNEISDDKYAGKADSMQYENSIDERARVLSTFIEYPLKRLRGSTKSPLNKRELDATLASIFDESSWNPVEGFDVNDISNDCYIIDCFDRVTGERHFNITENAPLFFTDIIEAIQNMYFEVLPRDADLRRDGYFYCQAGVKVEGSGNTLRESQILSELRSGLKDLTSDILKEGYRLEHSELLRTFINRSSVSIQIKLCGYMGDLSILNEGKLSTTLGMHDALAEEEMDEEDAADSVVLKIDKIANSFYAKRSSLPSLDVKIQGKIKKILGESYENISTNSLIILETAIKQFNSTRSRFDYDFAGISMQLCKVFERELSLIVFDPAKKALKTEFKKDTLKSLENSAKDRDDTTELRLLTWLLDKGPLELGSMRFILERLSHPDASPVICAFKAEILKLHNSEYVLSEDLQEACKLISSKYRNGGVHSKVITFKTCEDAFRKILEDEDSFLNRLANVKPSWIPSTIQ